MKGRASFVAKISRIPNIVEAKDTVNEDGSEDEEVDEEAKDTQTHEKFEADAEKLGTLSFDPRLLTDWEFQGKLREQLEREKFGLQFCKLKLRLRE